MKKSIPDSRAHPAGPPLRAICFDLFDTLIIVKRSALGNAMERLALLLMGEGFGFPMPEFITAYRRAAREHFAAAALSGRETHNRFWIQEALNTLGHPVNADDPRIANAIDAYFDIFNQYVALIPGTLEMLDALAPHYTLGLLSNFTHAPAARSILRHSGLIERFDVVLISDELGFRKPHPRVFQSLRAAVDCQPAEILFVGDNPDDDIQGALNAGMHAVHMTYSLKVDRELTDTLLQKPVEMQPNIAAVDNWEEFRQLLISDFRYTP